MGSLADLIVAPFSDAEAIVTSEYPLGTFSGVNVDGLDPIQIAALHSLLIDKEYGELLGEYEPVAEGSPNGPWLIRFPAELIAALANIAPQNQASIAAQWASADQLQEVGWSAQDAEKFLARLVHFAQIASFEEQEIFLCAYD
ncbi:MAG: hypothetical protein ACE5JF_10720 [Anaerolineales bacterium]